MVLSSLHDDFTVSSFCDVSCLDSSTDSNDSVTSDASIDVYQGCAILVREHPSKLKFGHINVNCMAGFKFYEIKQWLIKGNLDVIVFF